MNHSSLVQHCVVKHCVALPTNGQENAWECLLLTSSFLHPLISICWAKYATVPLRLQQLMSVYVTLCNQNKTVIMYSTTERNQTAKLTHLQHNRWIQNLRLHVKYANVFTSSTVFGKNWYILLPIILTNSKPIYIFSEYQTKKITCIDQQFVFPPFKKGLCIQL